MNGWKCVAANLNEKKKKKVSTVEGIRTLDSEETGA